MGWIIAALSRLTLIIVWITTPLVTRAFDGAWLFPVLGFIFLPITALAYVLVYVPGVGVSGWSWLWIALAVLLDLAAHSSGAYSSRKRFQERRAA